MPLFTVFTPTFNRAEKLSRVWESLQAQTVRDFEWLIVDDGSTDATQELLHAWKNAASFPVRIYSQPNRGKHVAMNVGAREAHGELFLIADSDDTFDANALELFSEVWGSIAPNERHSFVGVTARCRTQHGAAVGTPLPRPVLDSDNLELHYRYRVRGEKWGFVRTDVLRRFPCDETPEMGAFPWGRIAAAGYRTRYIEQALRTYYVDEGSDSMSKTVTVRRPMTNVRRNLETLNLGWKFFGSAPLEFVKSAVHLARFARAAGLSLGDVARQLEPRGARWLLRAAWPTAALFPVKVV